MGSWTDACLAAFRERTGIKPAQGDRMRAICDLQAKCFEVIKVMELESSGIRGGDGGWHGSDVVGAVCGELIEAAELVAYGSPEEREERRRMFEEMPRDGSRPWRAADSVA